MIAEMGPTSKHEERLTEMVEKYQLPLLKMCRMYLKDKTSAEDAVQETFLRAYRALPQFRDECSEKTWLMRIALNICHDLAKSAWLKHTEKRINPNPAPSRYSASGFHYPDRRPGSEAYQSALAVSGHR